jgi:hypothetical protein
VIGVSMYDSKGAGTPDRSLQGLAAQNHEPRLLNGSWIFKYLTLCSV